MSEAKSSAFDCASLLTRGWYPKEMPPLFASTSYAHAFSSRRNDFCAVVNRFQRVTHPAQHVLATRRRVARVLHPIGVSRLGMLLESMWPAIYRFCCSSPFLGAGIQVCVENERAAERITCVAERPADGVILLSDIRSFYDTAQFSVVKRVLCERVRVGTDEAKEIETALALANGGKTRGLPVGPDVSFIMAELLAIAIDIDLAEGRLCGWRSIDDYAITIGAEIRAGSALETLAAVLSRYGLAINDRKTRLATERTMPNPIIAPSQSLTNRQALPIAEVGNQAGRQQQENPRASDMPFPRALLDDMWWYVWRAIAENRRIPEFLAAKLDGCRDAALAVMMFVAQERGLVCGNYRFPVWRSFATADQLYGDMWMFAYEASLRGWACHDAVARVTDDEFFGLLLRSELSFINDESVRQKAA